MPPPICPTCGSVVPDGARACPECGACDETGWSEESYANSAGAEEDEFDYDDFVAREFKGEERTRPRPLWIVIVAAALLLVLLLWVWG